MTKSKLTRKRSDCHPRRKPNPLGTPWQLVFDRDGTEDVGIICEGNGNEIVTSRHFWLPEEGDETPRTLAALRVMAAAPKLLNACLAALSAMEEMIEGEDPQARTQIEWESEPLVTLRLAITEATANELVLAA